MMKTILQNEPQHGAARLWGRKKAWARTLEPEWDEIDAQIPVGQQWWLAISQILTHLSSKIREAYFPDFNSFAF